MYMIRLVNRFNHSKRSKTDLVLAKWVDGELEEVIFKTTNAWTESERNKVNYLIKILDLRKTIFMSYCCTT